MNYIIISQYGTVYGWGSCQEETFPHIDPGAGRQAIPDVDPPQDTNTYWRYVDGSMSNTGQPILPPASGLSWDDETAQWVDLRNLEQIKDAKWEEIKKSRTDAEYAGFVWDGSTFDSDPLSQQKIIGASQLASLNPELFSIDWTLADNTVRTLNAQEMNAVGIALGQHVNAQYVKARGLRQQIEAATSRDAVNAVAW